MTDTREYARSVQRVLFELPEADAISAEARQTISDRLIPVYVNASVAAKEYQRRHRRAGKTVYLLSPIAVAVVAVGTLWPSISHLAFAVDFALMATILIVVGRAHRLRTHSKWIESRLRVEHVRHAMILAACGVTPLSVDTPQIASYSDEQSDALARFAVAAWVKPQREYQDRIARIVRARSHFFERAGVAVFVLAMVAAAMHLALIYLYPSNVPHWMDRALILLALTLPAVGAALGGYRAHREYSKLARRSAVMASHLQALEPRYNSITNLADLESLLHETERCLVQETEEWLLLMDAARLEVVA